MHPHLCPTAGPHGNPNRYDPSPRPEEGVSQADSTRGIYERSISLFRASYSTVTQSRAAMPVRPLPTPSSVLIPPPTPFFQPTTPLLRPDTSLNPIDCMPTRQAFVGARVWLCQYMPAMSTYTPLYVAAPQLPTSYTVGSLFKVRPHPPHPSPPALPLPSSPSHSISLWQYTRRASYWAAASVGNWATRFYRYIRVDVEATQKELEDPLIHASQRAEAEALALLALGRVADAGTALQTFADGTAKTALDAFNTLFETLIAKYRDGYRVLDLASPNFEQEYLFYPMWWLKLSGFFRIVRALLSHG